MVTADHAPALLVRLLPLFAAAAVPGAANEWAVGTVSNEPLILSHG
jgi:hypothetical protein